jgi:hypothetical protein
MPLKELLDLVYNTSCVNPVRGKYSCLEETGASLP